MPSYDYKCLACDRLETIMHSIKKEFKPICVICGDVMVKQMGTGGYVDFKGTGFYCNDYPKQTKTEN